MGQRWTSGGKGPLAGDREKFKFLHLEHTFWTQPPGLTIEFGAADLNTTRVEEPYSWRLPCVWREFNKDCSYHNWVVMAMGMGQLECKSSLTRRNIHGRASQDGSSGKVLVIKLNNLNPVSRTNMVERKNKFYQVVLWTPHAFCGTNRNPLET